jgi:hypothetical protein
MSTLKFIAPEDDANLKNRELVYVAALIMLGVVFAFLILSGVLFR